MDAIVALSIFDKKHLEDYLISSALKKLKKQHEILYEVKKFNIHEIPNGNFRHIFRFEKSDIFQLHKAMQLPQKFVTPDRHVIHGIEGLCLLLRRFAYPNRLKDAQSMFGRHYSSLSRLLRCVCEFVYEKWGPRLCHYGKNKWFSTDLIAEMAAIVHEKGAPINNCFGFIDGTTMNICRPHHLQREVYSGHKRLHCLKFQCISLPNGIILHLSLPYSGRRHDAFMLKDSAIMEQLHLYCNGFCIYSDEGYPLREQLMRPYSTSRLSPEQQEWNLAMSSLRECVEWSFCKIVQQFAFVDFKKNLKLFLQPIGMYYIVAALLTNAHTCLYGSQISIYFNIESLNLNEYFQYSD